MRKLSIICSILLLSGCVPSSAKSIVRNKHAESYVLSQRVKDDNPNNDPSQEELKSFMVSTAKDWESMDRLLNNWKPKSGSIKPIDLEGNVSE